MTSKWEKVKLGDIATVRRESGSSADAEVYVGLEHLAPGSYVISGSIPVSEVSSQTTAFFKGDVLFGKLRPYLRKVAIVNFDGCCTNEILVWKPTSDYLISSYLGLLLQGNSALDHAISTSAGSRMPRTNFKDMANLNVFLPPLSEQCRIVDLIGALDDAIEAAEEVAKSSLQLADGLAGSVYEALSSEDSMTLQDALGATGTIQTGPFGSQLHKSDYQTTGIPVVMPTNIKDNRVSLEGIARISSEMAEKLSRHILKSGDIVWSRRGDVTRFALIDDETSGMICGTGCLLIRAEDPGVTDWLTVWFSSNSMKSLLVERAVGATMLNLNTKILGQLPVVAPGGNSYVPEALLASHNCYTEAKSHALSLRALRSELLTALLSGAHEIPESYDEVMTAV